VTDPYSDQPIKGNRDLPELSEDEVEKRIGVQAPPPRRPPVRVRAARRERARYVGATRRRVLWRDSAIILIGVVLALLAVRFLLPSGSPTADGSPSPDPSSIIAAASPTPTALLLTPIPTIGQIVNPSLNLRATPTPIPVITLPPATPRPTLAPGATPRPTLAPGATPTPTSRATTPRPKPTPVPAPVAVINCTPSGLSVSCTGASSQYASTYTWSFGDGSAPISGTSKTANHVYAQAGTYTVTLTVSNTTGSNPDQQIVTVG
jgi:PKD domain